MLDDPIDPRVGEDIDAVAISRFIRSLGISVSDNCQIQQFPDGASNLTYLIKFSERAFVLRRPPLGTKAKSAHDMKREFQVLQSVIKVFPYVPKTVALCDDLTLLGYPFYLMEQVKGVILRSNPPEDIVLTPEINQKLCHSLIDKLVALHQIEVKGTELELLGKGSGYCRRQIMGWSQRYRAAKTPGAADFETIIKWLEDNHVEGERQCIIHNDFRFDNVVLDAKELDRIICILDWEMATIGDPLLDLGGALAYWVQSDDHKTLLAMRRQPTHLEGMLTRHQVVEEYFDKMKMDKKDFSFYLVFGFFRLAAIAQQIYYRYYHGQTQDIRFHNFPEFIHELENQCHLAIQKKVPAWLNGEVQWNS